MLRSILVIGLTMFALGCAGSSGAQKETTSGPMNDPPADAQDGELPDGPDAVISDTEVPETYAAPEASDSASVVSRSEVERFMDKGPSYVLTIVKVDPARNESGKFVGYQIVEVTQDARSVMMPQLRVGDVVTHVNGVKLEKPDDLIAAWKALKQVDVAVVDFTRQGEPKQASWSIQ